MQELVNKENSRRFGTSVWCPEIKKRSLPSTRESEGATIWKEGTILSTTTAAWSCYLYINESGVQVCGPC